MITGPNVANLFGNYSTRPASTPPTAPKTGHTSGNDPHPPTPTSHPGTSVRQLRIKPREWGNNTMSARPSPTPATLPALLSVTKAAEILGISRASAYRYAASGELPTRRLGGRVYVVTARLMDIVEG